MTLFSLLLIVTVINITYASWGDIDPMFQSCLRSCNAEKCMKSAIESFKNPASSYKPPLLQVVPLSCSELCNYGCINEMSENRRHNGYPQIKYYGHWAFVRYFGLEEPASVVFSILNAFPHISFFITQILKSKTTNSDMENKETCYMQYWLMLYSTIATICWFSSAIYHSKKTKNTTQLDLITALLFIITGLFLVIRRIYDKNANYYSILMISSILYIFWGIRAYYMLQNQISFDNHMKTSIFLVILTTTLWFLWLLYIHYNNKTHINSKVKYLCFICQIWLILASALEIFDFPPLYGIFDAHSLWHLVTIPLGYVWYIFWNIDKIYRLNKKNE